MYSFILFFTAVSRSVEERSSTTKSGQRGMNRGRFDGGSAASRLRRTHDASGERVAPLGSLKPAEESNALPVPPVSAQLPSWRVSSPFLIPASSTVGDMR